jgi:hypothetical protein
MEMAYLCILREQLYENLLPNTFFCTFGPRDTRNLTLRLPCIQPN